ncbi:hypothetical protein [Pseudomonas sp. OIL-1]|uniref:hypothetical protein n=1 Tax=Pseudomonas sp. OIL-1 TaxID=2706126 RepID=UPI0013A770CE|nr:hypothetical protein [Pseudomonas sp. OIL-1]QIB52337.1 hypothetical protein G3M63_15565 [Pseudomonas sp. OIL-1]
MRKFNRIKERLIISALSVAVLSAVPLTGAMAEDGADRLKEFHKVAAREQRIDAEPAVKSASSSDKRLKQANHRSASLKRFQKRHRYGFSKRNGR